MINSTLLTLTHNNVLDHTKYDLSLNLSSRFGLNIFQCLIPEAQNN